MCIYKTGRLDRGYLYSVSSMVDTSMRFTIFFGLVVLTIDKTETAQRLNVASVVDSVKSQLPEYTTFEELCSLMGLHANTTFVRKSAFKAVTGRTKEKYQQLYHGLEVVGGGISAVFSPTRGYTGTVSGEVFTSLNDDIADPYECNQTEEAVQEVAFAAENITASQASNVYVKRNIYVLDDTAYLNYEITFFRMIKHHPRRPCYFIHACNLTVAYIFDNIQHKVLLERQGRLKNRVKRQFTEEYSTQPTHLTGETTGESTPEITPQENLPGVTLHENSSSSTTQQNIPGITTQDTSQQITLVTQSLTNKKQAMHRGYSLGDDECPVVTTKKPKPAACSNPARGTGGNQRIGRLRYGTQPLCLRTIVKGSKCILENQYVRVIDLKGSTGRFGKSVASYTCSKGYNDAINGAYSPVLDAMYFGTASARMFIEWYGMRALNYRPKIYCHYGRRYENAFWDGYSLTFGDGHKYFYPLIGLDVVAHELAHGFTDANSRLIYSGQSGGINEAFADITGEATEMFARGSNDWVVGADIFKRKKMALRYFQDPTRDRRSIKHVRDYKRGVDVHHSSGIFNHAFYQMVHRNKMPMRQAYECFVIANTNYWRRITSFEEGARDVVRACYDLGYDHRKAKRSFQAVGIKFNGFADRSFMETLSSTETLNELTVSASRTPVFILDPPQGATQFTANCTGSDGPITMSVYDDLESDSPIATEVGEMVCPLDPTANVSLYLRLVADTDIDMNDITMYLAYE